MRKYLFLLFFAFVPILGMCQVRSVIKGTQKAVGKEVVAVKLSPRINGANITGYSVPSMNWAKTYRLNERFLTDIKKIPSPSVQMQVSVISPSVQVKLPEIMGAHFQPVTVNELNVAQREVGIVSEKLEDKLQWIQNQPELGKNHLREIKDIEVDYNFIHKMSETNLVFVGEIHGNLAPRVAFADMLEKFRGFYPDRKIVVFSEAAYLKPIAGEEVFPYEYSRRGSEAVEEPIDFADVNNPNYRLVEDERLLFREMFEKLSKNKIEVYPIEDAVVAQKQSAQGVISTVEGLAERNRGFARGMRAQMEKIRTENPDALFIYFGGMAHTAWSMPMSLPKFFADETPLVVELVGENSIEKTFSLLPNIWEKGHPAFTKAGYKRMFAWDEQANPVLWGKNVGFDCRIVIP